METASHAITPVTLVMVLVTFPAQDARIMPSSTVVDVSATMVITKTSTETVFCVTPPAAPVPMALLLAVFLAEMVPPCKLMVDVPAHQELSSIQMEFARTALSLVQPATTTLQTAV